MLGEVVGEKYEIVRALAPDVLYEAFMARALGGGREVVLWLPTAGLLPRPEARVRFVGAARQAAAADVAHQQRVVDAGVDPKLGAWVGLAPTIGQTLAERIARGKPAPDPVVAFLAQGLAQALDGVHAAGLVHGFLRAGDIVMAGEWPRLAGMGLWVTADRAAMLTALRPHVHLLAPEVRAGETPSRRADVYAMAVILAEVALGQGAESPAEAAAIRNQLKRDRPRLEAALRGALSTAPNERPPTAGHLATELRLLAPPAKVRRPTIADVRGNAGEAGGQAGGGGGRAEAGAPMSAMSTLKSTPPPIPRDALLDAVPEFVTNPVDTGRRRLAAGTSPPPDAADLSGSHEVITNVVPAADVKSPALPLPAAAEALPFDEAKLVTFRPPSPLRLRNAQGSVPPEFGRSTTRPTVVLPALVDQTPLTRVTIDALETPIAVEAPRGKARADFDRTPTPLPLPAPHEVTFRVPATGTPRPRAGSVAITAAASQAPLPVVPRPFTGSVPAFGEGIANRALAKQHRLGALGTTLLSAAVALVIFGGVAYWWQLRTRASVATPGEAEGLAEAPVAEETLGAPVAAAPVAAAAAGTAAAAAAGPAVDPGPAAAAGPAADPAAAAAAGPAAADAPSPGELVLRTGPFGDAPVRIPAAAQVPAAAPAPQTPCAADMLLVENRAGRYCIDRDEAHDAAGTPHTGVDHAAAAAACTTAGKRLCAGAEWEEACRGKSRQSYPWGATPGESPCNMGPGGIVERLGSHEGCVSASGARDMSGNVAEWDADGRLRGGSAIAPGDGRCSRSSRLAGRTLLDAGYRCCTSAR